MRVNISCNFIDYRSIIAICIKSADSPLHSLLLYCRSRNLCPSISNIFLYICFAYRILHYIIYNG